MEIISSPSVVHGEKSNLPIILTDNLINLEETGYTKDESFATDFHIFDGTRKGYASFVVSRNTQKGRIQ